MSPREPSYLATAGPEYSNRVKAQEKEHKRLYKDANGP